MNQEIYRDRNKKRQEY